MRPFHTRTGWIFLILIPLVASLFYPLVFPGRPFYLTWIDGLTYASLLMLMAGGVLLVRNGRFFYGFMDSCKRFWRSMRKKESFIREQEGRRTEPVYQQKTWSPMPFLLVGFFYFLLTLALSILSIS